MRRPLDDKSGSFSVEIRWIHGGGFTLVELMVVVAIIVALIAILVPSLGYMQRSGNHSHVRSQLGTLQTALQAYYGDFNTYPSSSPSTYAGPPAVLVTRGSAMLAEALLGYLPGTADGAGNPPYAGDPAFGFRVTRNGRGKIYGPYAPNDPKGYRVNSATDQVFVDMYGGEILYYRSTRAGANATLPIPKYIFGTGPGTGTDAYFLVSDNSAASASATPPNQPNGPMQHGAGGSPDPGWQLYSAIAQSPDPTGANKYSGGTVMGSDSYLLLSGADDKQYFDDDDIVVGKQ